MAEREMKHKTLRFQAAKGNCGSKGACGRASLDLPLFLMSQIKKSSCNLVETVFFEIQLANLQFRSCYRVRLRKKSEVRSFFKLRHLTLKLWFCWKKQCLEVSRKSSMEWSYHIFVCFFFLIYFKAKTLNSGIEKPFFLLMRDNQTVFCPFSCSVLQYWQLV